MSYYRHDSQDEQDTAPIGPGSTEQRDAALADAARYERGKSPENKVDFWMTYDEATRKHSAPDADLVAWAVPLVEGRPFASRDQFTTALGAAYRLKMGRALLDSERRSVLRVAEELWAARQRAEQVAC